MATGIMTWQHVFNLALELRDGQPWSKMPAFEKGVIRILWECFDKDNRCGGRRPSRDVLESARHPEEVE